MPVGYATLWPDIWTADKQYLNEDVGDTDNLGILHRHREIPNLFSERPSGAVSAVQVILVGNVLHPRDGAAIDRLRDRNVSHRSLVGSTVPVALVSRDPDRIARRHLMARLPLALDPAATGCDDQDLPSWVPVPSCPGPWLEGYEPRRSTAGCF